MYRTLSNTPLLITLFYVNWIHDNLAASRICFLMVKIENQGNCIKLKIRLKIWRSQMLITQSSDTFVPISKTINFVFCDILNEDYHQKVVQWPNMDRPAFDFNVDVGDSMGNRFVFILPLICAEFHIKRNAWGSQNHFQVQTRVIHSNRIKQNTTIQNGKEIYSRIWQLIEEFRKQNINSNR